MQTRNNYQLEWEIRTKYGLSVDKGTGVFNGDMGIVREINDFAETMTVEFMRAEWWNIHTNCWMSWNWRMRLPYKIAGKRIPGGRHSTFVRTVDAYEPESAVHSGHPCSEMCDAGRQ